MFFVPFRKEGARNNFQQANTQAGEQAMEWNGKRSRLDQDTRELISKRPTGPVPERNSHSFIHSFIQSVLCDGCLEGCLRGSPCVGVSEQKHSCCYSLLSIYSAPPSAALKGSSMGKAGQKGLEAKSFKTEHMT